MMDDQVFVTVTGTDTGGQESEPSLNTDLPSSADQQASGPESAELTRVKTDGTLREAAGRLHLLYRDPETGDRVHIIAGEDCVEMRRHGAGEAVMVFDPHKRTGTDYRTAYGTIHMDIQTHSVSVKQLPEGLLVSLNYSLMSGEERIVSRNVEIQAVSVNLSES